MDEDMVKLAEEYAEVAYELLEEEGIPFDDDDVIKVAAFLIDNDYEDEGEEDFYDDEDEYDEEMVRTAAFYDELEKDAARKAKAKKMKKTNVGLVNAPLKGGKIRQGLTRMGYGISRAIKGKKRSFNPKSLRYKAMMSAAKNPRAWAGGAIGAGALAAGGAGYAGYKAMTKKSEYIDYLVKEAKKKAKAAKKTNVGLVNAPLKGGKMNQRLTRMGYGISRMIKGKKRSFNPKSLRYKAMMHSAKNPRTWAAGALGAGALAAGGAGYGAYRAMKN